MTSVVRGLDEIERRLKRVPKAMKRGANSPIRFGLLKMGNVVRDAAKDRAPRKSGELQDGIKNRKTPKRRERAGVVSREVVSTDFKSRWVEFGTGIYFSGRGRSIKPKKKQILMNRDTREIFGTEIKGQRPQPFMRPAMISSHRAAVQAFVKGAQGKLSRIEKEIKRS